MKVISVSVAPDQADWLKAQGNVSEALRKIIARAKDPAGDLFEPEQTKRKLPKRVRFLNAVSDFFHIRKAIKIVEVKDKELEKWLADEAFAEELQARQMDFINDTEWLIIECAKGLRHVDKSAMTGLIAFLNNHHPNWGRVKIELLSRIFGPVFDGLLKIVKDKVNETTYRAIAEEFERFKEINFAQFSD